MTTETEIKPEPVNLTPEVVIEATEVKTKPTPVCACGTTIERTGQRGRPAKICLDCKAKDAAKVAHVSNCKTCEAPLPAPEGRGRPAHRCVDCERTDARQKAERAAKRAEKAAAKLSELVPA